MKGLFTLRVLWMLLPALPSLTAHSQPDYSFINAVLESGTDLQTGAVYKFSLVKTGVDARITIMGSTGNVTLSSIDENWTGFDEAFQPFINVGANANGYVEFKVEFYLASTTTKVTQNLIPVTCIDVDGKGYEDGVLFEQDQVQFFPGYYDYTMTGGNLLVTPVSNWMVIKNTSGISYPGIDTTAKDVMATVVNRNVSSFLLRIGALNTSSTESDVRYRSVYFKKFNYGHPEPLAISNLFSFAGYMDKGHVNLHWEMAMNRNCKVMLERSSASADFSTIEEYQLTASSGGHQRFSYTDDHISGNVVFYRLRSINEAGKTEYSNILRFRLYNGEKPKLTIFPTVVQSYVTVSFDALEKTNGFLLVTDLSGRSVKQQQLSLNKGQNSITIYGFENLMKGSYIVSVRTLAGLLSKQVIVQ